MPVNVHEMDTEYKFWGFGVGLFWFGFVLVGWMVLVFVGFVCLNKNFII